MYKLSLIIPVYNSEKCLEKTIDSILPNDIFNNIEIILIDDGSKDKSWNIIQKYIDNFDNIIGYKKENMGVSQARNDGIKLASAPYIMFLDSDDLLTPNCISELFINVTCDVDLIVGGFLMSTNQNNIIKIVKKIEIADSFLITQEEILDTYFSNFKNKLFLTSCGKIYKKEIINKYNLNFNYKLRIGEDSTFVQDYIKHCKIVMCKNIDVFNYLIDTNGSAMKKVDLSRFTDLNTLYQHHTDFSQNMNLSTPQEEILNNFYYRACFVILECSKNYVEAKKIIKFILANKNIQNLNKKKYYNAENRIYKMILNTKCTFIIYFFSVIRKKVKSKI